MGAIDFRHTASVQFLLVNCGSDDLETHSSLHGLGEDVVSATIEDISYNSYDKQYDRTHNPAGSKLRLLPLKMDDMVKCPPGDTLLLGMDLSNMYGRTGRFAKDIALPYNHGRDTLHLTVKGVYTGNANNDSIVEDLVTSFYKNGVLIKKIQRSSTGHILYEKFYDGGYCIQQNEYSYNGKISKELFYTKGTLSMERYYNLNGEFNRQTYYENGYGYRTINTKE